MAEERKGIYEMVREFCREAAVLIFVFGNLDIWFKSFTGELWKLGLGFWAIVSHVLGIFAVAAVFGIIGILFEKWRET
ncbi:MAG: hypothetical protein WA681_00120 [Candidatus Acidiferrales bacterium]